MPMNETDSCNIVVYLTVILLKNFARYMGFENDDIDYL